MRRALFDSAEGYYATQAELGPKGDFSTSATMSPAFGEAVANWIKQVMTANELPEDCPIIELGPGNGALTKEISTHLPDSSIHLVESSDKLRVIQSSCLADIPHSHHSSLAETLKTTDGLGVIIGNEFIDAFPAAKLRWIQEDWHEVGVSWENGQPQEILAPLARDIDADAPANPKAGETIYVHPSFHNWLQANIPALKKGALLFIDYGAERPARECRAYANQERYEDLEVYQCPGSRDITCDVNFTDLTRWCQQLGLQTNPVTTQASFLETYLPDLEARRESEESLAFISNPFAAGGAFRVFSAMK